MRNRKQLVCLAVSIAFLSACAKSPGKISPALVTGDVYMSSTCKDLVAETTRIDTDLGIMSVSQKKAARADVIALIVVGIPVTWLYKGDKGKQIAQLKGEMLAVEDVALAQGCTLPDHTDVRLEISETDDAEGETDGSDTDDAKPAVTDSRPLIQ